MVDELIEFLGTRDEMEQLATALVRTCGCGCTYGDGELIRGEPDCTAVQGLRHRRFVVGLLFARQLRPQLLAEEWAAG